jgi:hypothetical protein
MQPHGQSAARADPNMRIDCVRPRERRQAIDVLLVDMFSTGHPEGWVGRRPTLARKQIAQQRLLRGFVAGQDALEPARSARPCQHPGAD